MTMDASLNSGDSGGPLIDLEGNLIGINESCAGHPFENAATAVKVAIERMDAMLRSESSGASLPDPESGLELDSSLPSTHQIIFDPANEFGGRNAMDVRGAFDDATWDASDWVVRIFKEGDQIALGLIVDADGYIVTKASEVDPRQERILVGTASGLLEEAIPVGIDSKLDLLLLRLPPGNWTAAPLKEAPIPEAGTWVVSAGPDAEPISFGICGLDQYESDLSILDRAFLGVQVDRPARGATGAVVRRIVPGCAARRAGLRRGDVILAIDDVAVRGSRGLIDVLSTYCASDIVEIDFKRGEEEMMSSVRLGSRVFSSAPLIEMGIEFESGNLVIPVSRRDTGFGRVIQHDGLVRPEQCGGPLVDLDGQLVGINIARSDRTKTFAIPVMELRASIERMSEHPGVAKTLLAIDPRTLQVPIRSDADGTFSLAASDAQLFGPTARYFQGDADGNIGNIGNWLSVRDEVLWVIDSPEPGAYEVNIEQACVLESAGGRFTVVSNRDSIESMVRPTGSASEYKRYTLGEIEVGEGERVIISIRPLEDPRRSLMHLRSIELVPVLD
jgi:serine protease Do